MTRNALQNRIRDLSIMFLICLISSTGWMADARENNSGFNKNDHAGNNSKESDHHARGFRDHRSGFHRFSHQGYIFIGPDWLRDTTFIYEGTPYFYYDGIYFTRVGNVFAATTPSFASYNSPGLAYTEDQAKDTITLDVPAGEGHVPVKLVKLDNGYRGPYGEFYPTGPTVDELKPIYGY
jgi:hypothetical protein